MSAMGGWEGVQGFTPIMLYFGSRAEKERESERERLRDGEDSSTTRLGPRLGSSHPFRTTEIEPQCPVGSRECPAGRGRMM